MQTLSFLSQPLLWGTALAAVPIIIHLLYRRRFRRVDWAPMRYLKLSMQRNRRRIRLEQLLLLALRVLAVLLLFFAVARPVVHARGLGSWLGGRSRTSQVLLLDDSLSMGYEEGGRLAFERAQELALEILNTVGAKDRFTLVASSNPRSPLLREVEVTDRDAVAAMIRGPRVSETLTSWGATLAALDELIAAATYPIREVTLVTDLRRAGWDVRVRDLAKRWASGRVRLRIFDVGSEQAENLALLDLQAMDRVPLAGTPARWQASVRNGGGQAIEGLETTWTVDGKPQVVRLPAIAAGETARVVLSATFQEPGLHHVSLRLPGDALPGDNERWAVAAVRDRLRLLLVDGEPSSQPLGGEVDFLALALSLGVGEADAWDVEVTTDAPWSGALASQPDLVVLANVAGITPAQAAELGRLVESGMGLMIFVGDQVDSDSYNQVLYREGAGLLPARLEGAVESEATGLIVEEVTPSPLEALRQLNPAVLQRVRVRKVMHVEMDESPDDRLRAGRPGQEDSIAASGSQSPPVRVLARWNDAASSPAALEKRVGRGRVMLWTMAADRAWSDWPAEPSYVLTMREAAKAIARAEAGVRELTAGKPLRRPITPGRQATSPVVEMPGLDSPQPLRLEEVSAGSPEGRVLAFEDTRRAGLYRLGWREDQGGLQHDLFAVNPDRRESELVRISAEDLRGLFGTLEPEIIAASAGQSGGVMAVRGEEIWRSLAAVLLGLLVVETCFATWVGRQR